MTFQVLLCHALIRMGFTMWDVTRDLSTWEPITIPGRLRWHPSVAGGAMKGGANTRNPKALSLRLMAAEATVGGYGYGKWSCRNWRMRRVCCFQSVIFLQAPASGTKLSIDSFRSSLQIGGVSRYEI